jgi:hypothetical protein
MMGRTLNKYFSDWSGNDDAKLETLISREIMTKTLNTTNRNLSDQDTQSINQMTMQTGPNAGKVVDVLDGGVFYKITRDADGSFIKTIDDKPEIKAYNPENMFSGGPEKRQQLMDVFSYYVNNAIDPNTKAPLFQDQEFKDNLLEASPLRQYYKVRDAFVDPDLATESLVPNQEAKIQALKEEDTSGILDLADKVKTENMILMLNDGLADAEALNHKLTGETMGKLWDKNKTIDAMTALLPKNQDAAKIKMYNSQGPDDPNAPKVEEFNRGGMVYASKGSHINFQPKGTDTVPAMLTPGEFVVNRASTQQNLPLLKSINSGAGRYQKGGSVGYYNGGGIVAALETASGLAKTALEPLLLKMKDGLLKPMTLDYLEKYVPGFDALTSAVDMITGAYGLYLGESAQTGEDSSAATNMAAKSLDAVKLAGDTANFVDAIKLLRGGPLGKKFLGGVSEKGVAYLEMLQGAYDGYMDQKAISQGMDPATRMVLGVISGSASSGGAYTNGSVSAAIGRPLSENEDEMLAALEATARGAMIGNDIVPGGLGLAAGAILGAASEPTKVGIQVWNLRSENAARKKKLDAEFERLGRRQAYRVVLKQQIEQRDQLAMGSKEYNSKQDQIYSTMTDIRSMGGSFPGDEGANQFAADASNGISSDSSTLLATTNTGGSRHGAQQLSSGGNVYASKGSHINFQPKGTDTVPAMLTPGEFVVNRQSTQQNLPVLKAINSGTYSHGDIVRNLSRGGLSVPRYYLNGTNNGVPATGQGPSQGSSQAFDFTSFMNTFKDMLKTGLDTLKSLSPQSSGVSDSSQGSVSSIDNFVSRLDKIATTLASLNIPPEIKITGKHDINVIINGDTVLNQLKPDLADIVASSIKKAFQDFKALNPSSSETMNFDI